MPDNRRLARDPLDELLASEATAGDGGRDRAGTAQGAGKGQAQRAARITVQVDDNLAEQVRNAVMWLHKVDVHTTISAIAEAGLRAELQRLADAHNHGQPFPSRTGDVPTGRPPGR